MADKKLGAYICKGCGIADRLDTDQLEKIAKREGKVALVKQHDFLCNSDGVKMIQADIDAGEVTHLVIAACSRRAKTDAFNFDNVAMSRANLREGVIWVRPNTDDAQETTQEMADDYVRMACAEAKFMTVPSSSGEQGRTPHVLVVGGGSTGLTAAIEVAKAGYSATIVEKSGELGGTAVQLYKRIPNRSPFADPQDNGVADLIKQVEDNDKITVHLNSTVSKTDGAPGRFSADITQEGGGTSSGTFGAIVQASGFKPYDASQLPEFAYG
jgi:quinone-modifying oxidoreductase subunit QmoB